MLSGVKATGRRTYRALCELERLIRIPEKLANAMGANPGARPTRATVPPRICQEGLLHKSPRK